MLAPVDLLADGLVTVLEAAAFLGLSRATIWSMMDRGDLPFVHGGADPGAPRRLRRIPRRALVDWAAARLYPRPTAPAEQA